MLWLVQPLSKKMSRHVGAEMLDTGNVWSLHKCTTRLFQAACELGKLSAHGGTSCLAQHLQSMFCPFQGIAI